MPEPPPAGSCSSRSSGASCSTSSSPATPPGVNAPIVMAAFLAVRLPAWPAATALRRMDPADAWLRAGRARARRRSP